MTDHRVVSREEWIAARQELLEIERAYQRRYDELLQQRLELPWTRVTREYLFDTADGRRTLADLFEGRNQLIVQHFMLGPGSDHLCTGCSLMADHMPGALPHLAERGVSFVAVSRAPLAEIQRVQERMGWPFRWVSSFGSSFNSDFGVSHTQDDIEAGRPFNYNYGDNPVLFDQELELPGLSSFYKDDDGAVYHTYSTYARGGDRLLNAYNYLDLTPKGRNEQQMMDWVRHHDSYETPAQVQS